MKLIVFSGLPGVGKTTLAKLLAEEIQAVYLRIDTIEQSLERSTLEIAEIKDAGYQAAYALAKDNLNLGLDVIADAVNSVHQPRMAWQKVAERTQSDLLMLEIFCSDKEEHKRRIESRTADICEHQLPTWQDVLDRNYEPWQQNRIIVDTMGKSVDEAYLELKTIVSVSFA